MYMWIGCKLPRFYESEIRRHCLALNERINLNTTAFSLPQHVSLKISFPVPNDQTEELIAFLHGWLREVKSFEVQLLPPEQAGNILWLPVGENPILEKLHEMLDTKLQERFGIQQHPFDKCFKFHSTLFMDEAEQLSQMLRLMEDDPFRRILKVTAFLIGISPDGSPGSYQVVREVSCREA